MFTTYKLFNFYILNKSMSTLKWLLPIFKFIPMRPHKFKNMYIRWVGVIMYKFDRMNDDLYAQNMIDGTVYDYFKIYLTTLKKWHLNNYFYNTKTCTYKGYQISSGIYSLNIHKDGVFVSGLVKSEVDAQGVIDYMNRNNT